MTPVFSLSDSDSLVFLLSDCFSFFYHLTLIPVFLLSDSYSPVLLPSDSYSHFSIIWLLFYFPTDSWFPCFTTVWLQFPCFLYHPTLNFPVFLQSNMDSFTNGTTPSKTASHSITMTPPWQASRKRYCYYLLFFTCISTKWPTFHEKKLISHSQLVCLNIQDNIPGITASKSDQKASRCSFSCNLPVQCHTGQLEEKKMKLKIQTSGLCALVLLYTS